MAQPVGTLKPRTILAASPGGDFSPSFKEKTFGALTASLGTSSVIDTAAGAAVGWVIAPSEEKVGYALGGGLATGVFGWLGLAGTLVWRFAVDRRRLA